MLRIRLAGELTADKGDGHIGAPGLERRQVRLAFALLVWQRHRLVERDELADLLWSDELPDSWEAALRNIMSGVRLVLRQMGLDPQQALTNTFSCYQLRFPAGTEVDVETATQALTAADGALAGDQFAEAADRAEAALAVLQRPFLAGESGRWAEERQAELADRRIRCLQILADARRLNGQVSEATAVARQLVQVAPYDEHNHRLLISAHAAAGNRPAALQAYDACRTLLADELGVEPAAATQALYQSLIMPATGVGEIEPRHLNQPAFATPFVGRADELANLRTAWNQARGGTGRVVMVGGEAGIGKTRLAAEFASTAASDNALVLYGAATQGVPVPYEPFVEAFQTLADATPETIKAAVQGEGAGLLRLLPGLRSLVPTDDGLPDRDVLFSSVSAALRMTSGGRPVVLILDDLHWAGPDTLALLAHLARSAYKLPGVAVIATYRRPEPAATPELAATLADLRRHPSVEFIDLSGIDQESVAALGEALAGRRLSRRLVADVWNETAGNPFFASEVLAELSQPTVRHVPRSVEDVVADRVRRLSHPSRSVLETASVVGVLFPSSLTAAAGGISEPTVFDALDEAAAAGLVEPVTGKGQRYRFRHAIVQAAIYNGLGSGRRAVIHRQVARALASGPPNDDRVRLAALAYHWGIGAPGSSEAVAATRAAGDAAASAVAHAEAAALYGAALEHLDGSDHPDRALRAELLLTLGTCAKRAGKRADAEAALTEAADVARQIGSAELLARIALTRAGPERSNPLAVSAPFAAVNEALAAIGEADSPLRAALLARRAQMLAQFGDQAGTTAAAQRATEMATKLGVNPARAQALAARLPALPAPDQASERLQVANQLASVVGQDGDPELALIAAEHQAYSLLELGDANGAREAIARYSALTDGSGLSQGKWFAVQHQILLATLEGRFEQAERLVKQCVQIGRQVTDSRVAEMARTVYLTVPRWFQGRVPQLIPGLADIYRWVPDLANNPATRLFVSAHTTNQPDARQGLEAFFTGGDFDRVPMGPRWPALVFFLATSIATLDAPEGAEVLFDAVLPFAELNCVYYAFVFYGAYAYHLGRLALVLDRRKEAEVFLRLALERHRALDATPWIAVTEAAL